ncbi:hypothetical protein CFC21_021373 [Triticum aestivum]|uniref:Alginate lyase 2 domain-containing protein n=2 Tax=Triticum aestivum TaxID=4565 RepID=A0A3B6BYY4_WHEAT|nr:hypothetical protein CFC21_021373 [Triticum aestivum]
MASLTNPWLRLLVLLVAMTTFLQHALAAAARGSGNPTAGFQKVQLADGDFRVQSPYNVPVPGHDYSSGVWQFEGYGYVPSGTSGVSVMQIHNQEGAAHSTLLMLHVYDGVLRFYSGAAVEPNIYDWWFRLNVMHDVGTSTVAVYVDGERKFSTSVTPSESYYFKFGVYMQHHDQSSCMDSLDSHVYQHWVLAMCISTGGARLGGGMAPAAHNIAL